MAGVLIESGARTHLSPVALFASAAVWGLSFAAVTADRAATQAEVATASSAAERVRYVQPPLPSAEGDALGGFGFASGLAPIAAARGVGGGRGGHQLRPRVKQMAPLPQDKPPGDGGEVYIEADVDTPVS